ncbi:hypothetical protein [Paracoccus sp. 22332]|uniref:hypothetical protein n=1 Tax=Paracoccus sp. 22332 TaxID=3453913 RepID=UPI003F86513A
MRLYGGNDRIAGGEGDDILWGDGTATGITQTVLCDGVDTFVFSARRAGHDHEFPVRRRGCYPIPGPASGLVRSRPQRERDAR